MTDFRVDAIVVGAGVIGLAVARRLSSAGLETLVLEKGPAIGMETSSRNSEVIHAGLYYPKGSIKARACVAGREMLYRYCDEHGITAKNCGKLMLASSAEQLPGLRTIWDAATANGVTELAWITPEEVAEIEPEIHCVGAFISQRTGIVDSHAYMQALQADIEAAGGAVVFRTPVLKLMPEHASIRIFTGGDEPAEIGASLVVNAAGHGAPRLAASTEGIPESAIPRQWYAKGNYFSLAGRQPFSRLIYPLPEVAGLGVHATIDLQGRCRFGPDVEWVDSDTDLAVDPAREAQFYKAIRAYWPGLPDGSLQPDYAGIRPKIHGPNMPAPDFRIDGPQEHGISGLVNLFGIESPGLTASLALADMVAEKLGH